MANEAVDFSNIDRLVHEPSRAVILSVLAAVESADFVYLKRETGLTSGNLSTHLSKLEAAGYVDIEKTYRGRMPLTLCRLTPEGRLAFENYRLQLMEFVRNTRE
jgi:DNA-binding MarR family transcriptional regulator